MADGKDCVCGAYGESDCDCAADWTPQELIDARAEIARLRGDAEIARLRLEAADEIARLRMTDEEREAVETAVRWLEPYPQVAATLRELLERLK